MASVGLEQFRYEYSVLSCVSLCAEIIDKVRSPPPLCRPTVSVDEAPLEVIQIMKQAWSEEPDKRPTFKEIFRQVHSLSLSQAHKQDLCLKMFKL